MQLKRAAEVDEAEQVLAKARAAKANRRVEKLGPDAIVCAHDVRHFRHVGAARFAHRRKRIDRRHTLRQHRIARQFRQFRRPEAGAQNALVRHPVRVHLGQRFHRLAARISWQAANQNTNIKTNKQTNKNTNSVLINV